MAKEICTLCDAETGRAGIGEDSMYPVLLEPVGDRVKGDMCGPVCEECFEAMEQLNIIDHEA